MTQHRQPPTPFELLTARQALKKTQIETAHLLGVTHAAYLRWEKGYTVPQPDRVEKLWKFVRLGEKIMRGERRLP